MPSYDYRCALCATTVTHTYSITEKPSTVSCQGCGSAMNQVYSVPVVTFNGNGFYSTDKKK